MSIGVDHLIKRNQEAADLHRIAYGKALTEAKDQQIKDLEELLLEAENAIDKRFDGKYLKLKKSYQNKYYDNKFRRFN